MISAGDAKCIKGVDFATGQTIDICPGRGVSEPAKEYPKREVTQVDPTNFDYKGFDLPVLGPTLGCQFVAKMKGHQHPLHYIGDFYAALFDVGRNIDGATISAVADTIDKAIDKEEHPHLKWWLARGGLPLAYFAIRDELRQVKNTEQAVAVLKNALTKAQAAGDTATGNIIMDLLSRPSEVLRDELMKLEVSARASSNVALAQSLNKVLNLANSKGVTHPVSTKDVSGSAGRAQATVVNNVRRTVVREVRVGLNDPAIPVEAREALKRVLNSPGSKNTWSILVGELKELNGAGQAKNFVQGVVDRIKNQHAQDIDFIEAIDNAHEQAQARIWNAFRGATTDAEVATSRRALMPTIFEDNLLGSSDGKYRFPFAFGADNGLLVEKRKALKEIAKAKKALRDPGIAIDSAKSAEIKLRQQQFKLTADEIDTVLEQSKGQGAAALTDEIEMALVRSQGAGTLGVPAVKALERVVKAGQTPIPNAFGVGVGSPLNLTSEVANGENSLLWRRVRGATAYAYENHTAFRTWAAAWLTFSQIMRGPDEILDAMPVGKDLRGVSRNVAYNTLAYGGMGASALIINHEYSRMVSGMGKTKASIGYGFMGFWLAYNLYWYGRSDQREAIRLQGGDPDSAANPLNFTSSGYNPNRPVSQYYSWLAETPMWALMPKITNMGAEEISKWRGWPTKTEMAVTAAERTALLSDADLTILRTAGLVNLPSKGLIYGQEGVRALEAAFGTWPRNRAFLLWLGASILAGSFLGTAQNFARSVTQGTAMHGAAIRPIFTGTGSQAFASFLKAMGMDMSGYGYYVFGMCYLYPWDYCNEIETVAPSLAMANIEWYRQEKPGTQEAEQKIQAFRFFYQMSTPKDQMDIREKFYDRFPEVFDGDVSSTAHASLLPADMMDEAAMACVGPERLEAQLVNFGVDPTDPWLAAVLSSD